jgi:2-polyprenyl-3-methyl-5-hydroxy-6-metoxy-1,4-benzoquinol methylase
MNMNETQSLEPDSLQDHIDKNYTSSNPIVRLVLDRLLRCLAKTLLDLDALYLSGLEIGCGEGNITQYLSKMGIIGNIVATDLQPKKLQFAKYQNQNVVFIASDINSLVFKEGTFDYILAMEIFEHLTDPNGAMNELRQVAKKNAFLIISVPHEPFFHWGNLFRGKYLRRMGRTPSHLNFWSRKQFRAFLTQHVKILEESVMETFPWLFYLCRFSNHAK